MKEKLARILTGRAVKNLLAFLFLAAVEAGLAYLGLTFYRSTFLNNAFRILLVVSDALFMLGFAWLVNRYIIAD